MASIQILNPLGHGSVLTDPDVVERVLDCIQLETGGMTK